MGAVTGNPGTILMVRAVLPGAERQEMDPAGLQGMAKRKMRMRRLQGMVKL